MDIARGDFVFSPIGKQMKLGVVWSLDEAEAGRELKSIVDRKATRSRAVHGPLALAKSPPEQAFQRGF